MLHSIFRSIFIFRKPLHNRVEWFWKKCLTLFKLGQMFIEPQFQNFTSEYLDCYSSLKWATMIFFKTFLKPATGGNACFDFLVWLNQKPFAHFGKIKKYIVINFLFRILFLGIVLCCKRTVSANVKKNINL